MDREIDYLLGGATKWKGKYKITWCETCEGIILTHDECHGTTCNGGGCNECHTDFTEFSKLQMDPIFFLDEFEKKTVMKYSRLRDLIFDCLDNGKKNLDWVWLQKEGKLSRNDEKMFDSEIFLAKIIGGVNFDSV